jgi:hypothetical protein
MSRRTIYALSLSTFVLVFAFTNCGLPTPIQNEGESNLNNPSEVSPVTGTPAPVGPELFKCEMEKFFLQKMANRHI